MAPSPIAFQVRGGIINATVQASIVSGGIPQASLVLDGLPLGGLVTGATVASGAVTDATPQASLIDGHTPHTGEFIDTAVQASNVTDGTTQASTVEDAQPQSSTVTGHTAHTGDVSGGTPLSAIVSGGIALAPVLQGNRPQTSTIAGATPASGAFLFKGLLQASIVSDFIASQDFTPHRMDVQCKILGAQEDPGHPSANTWALAGTDAINTERKTIKVSVPWPMFRRPGVLVWYVRGFYLNTNAATTSFGFELYKDTNGVDDATPFYQFTAAGLPFNAAATSGAFEVEIIQLIGGPFAGSFNQTIRSMGLFNAGNLVALGGAGHGATTAVYDVSRNTAACTFDTDRILTLATKKLTAQANVTLRTDSVYCIAYPSSGYVE